MPLAPVNYLTIAFIAAAAVVSFLYFLPFTRTLDKLKMILNASSKHVGDAIKTSPCHSGVLGVVVVLKTDTE